MPPEFVLYGGTALALQLGHRVSEDFDFFSSSGFDPDAGSHVWVHYKRDNLEGYVERGGSAVKVAFFGGLENLRRVEDPQRPVGSRVQVASLVDLRGNWKDYMDIHALVSHGIDIPTGLAAALAIDVGFQPENQSTRFAVLRGWHIEPGSDCHAAGSDALGPVGRPD